MAASAEWGRLCREREGAGKEESSQGRKQAEKEGSWIWLNKALISLLAQQGQIPCKCVRREEVRLVEHEVKKRMSEGERGEKDIKKGPTWEKEILYLMILSLMA